MTMSGELELFDTHAHLDHEKMAKDLAVVLRRAEDAGVNRILAVTSEISPEGFMKPVALVRDNGLAGAVVGIHPHEASLGTPDLLKRGEEVAGGEEEVKAVGEIGLDFHYDFSPREKQREVFIRQLQMARRVNKPVVLHIREAHDEALEILSREAGGEPWEGVVHCFSAGAERAKAYLDLGLHLSFTGILTFKKAVSVSQAAAVTPRNRLFLETDAPYLAPVPYRGKRC